MPSKLTILYNFADTYPRMSIIRFGSFILSIVGYFLIRHTMKTKETGEVDSMGILDSSKNIIIGLIFIPFGLFISFSDLNLSGYFKAKKVYDKNDLIVTEGYVSRLKVYLGKHDNLEFFINGKYFKLEDRNNYSCRFGDILYYSEIQDSSYLKITHYSIDEQDIIFKIEKN